MVWSNAAPGTRRGGFGIGCSGLSFVARFRALDRVPVDAEVSWSGSHQAAARAPVGVAERYTSRYVCTSRAGWKG